MELIKTAVKYCVVSCFVSFPLLTTSYRWQETNFLSLPILTSLFLNSDFSYVSCLPSLEKIQLPLDLSELQSNPYVKPKYNHCSFSEKNLALTSTAANINILKSQHMHKNVGKPINALGQTLRYRIF